MRGRRRNAQEGSWHASPTPLLPCLHLRLHLPSLSTALSTAGAGRSQQELLKRYNPTHAMSQEERVQATARRVGLNSPLEYKDKDE